MRTIERCKDLEVLTQVLARKAQGKVLKSVRGTKTREHHLVMVAPATVALCAIDAGLVDESRSKLRVLTINTGTLEHLDEGQWYRFVPAMLDWSVPITVTANVPDRSVLRQSTVRNAVSEGFRIEVQRQEGSLDALMSSIDPKEFDLAICFHGHQLWRHWPSNGVRQLVEAGVPLYVCEFNPLLAQLGMATAGLLGIEGAMVTERNRFALVSRVQGENWARTIWRCTGVDPGWDGPDEGDRTLATTAIRMVLDSHKRGLAEQPFAVGKRVSGLCRMDGVPAGADLVHALDGLVVSLQGEVLEWVEESQRLQPAGPVGESWLPLIQQHEEAWDGRQALLWATTVKQCWLSSQARVAA